MFGGGGAEGGGVRKMWVDIAISLYDNLEVLGLGDARKEGGGDEGCSVSVSGCGRWLVDVGCGYDSASSRVPHVDSSTTRSTIRYPLPP